MSARKGDEADEAERPVHPLSGSDARTFLRVLRQNGPVPLRSLPAVALAAAVVLARAPFSLYERLHVARRLRQASPPPAPLFILGHWRSGTTHLYNVLSRSPALGFVSPIQTALPWDFLTLGRLLSPWLERALPEHRWIDRIPVKPDSPQEDETAMANMQLLSFYHGLYFPSRFEENFRRGVFLEGCDPGEIAGWERAFTRFVRKLALAQPGRRPVIKNPVYTARIARLRALWPEARFVHIHRNPYVVYRSMRNFYQALFRALALQPWDHLDVDRLVLEGYPPLMRRLIEQSAELPPDRFVEVRFDEFEREPLGVLRRIHERLDLEGFERARPAFASYLESVAGYRKNVWRYPPEAIAVVREHWGEFIERWGYEPPDG